MAIILQVLAELVIAIILVAVSELLILLGLMRRQRPPVQQRPPPHWHLGVAAIYGLSVFVGLIAVDESHPEGLPLFIAGVAIGAALLAALFRATATTCEQPTPTSHESLRGCDA